MSHRALLVPLLTLSIAIVSAPLFAQVSPSQAGAGPASDLPNPSSTLVTGSINGTLVSIDGRGIADARIQVKDLNTGALVVSTFSKHNGSFEFYNLAPGNYELVATSGLSETHDKVQVMQGMAFVTLQIAAPVSDPSAGATVSVASMKVPGKARKEFEKAQKAFYDNKLEEAKERVEKAISAYPYYAEALTLRGILKVDDNKYEEGEADLQNAIKFDPNYGMAYIAMGAALNQVAKFEDALRSLQRGVAISPDSWQGHFEMAKAFLGKGDFAAALKNVVRAEKLEQNYPPLRLVKAHALLGLQQYDAAILELEGYLSKEPNGSFSDNARKTLDQAKAFVARGNSPAKAAVETGSR